MKHTFCPFQCIVPEHMVRHLIEKGDARTRQWLLNLLTLSERLRGRREILSALPLAVAPAAAEGKHRTIYDAKHSSNEEDLPGHLIRDEGDSEAGDPAVNEAYDGLGATYDLYKEVFDRNSIDDKGMRLIASVHFSEEFDNAFWNGHQMVFGDGDGEIFVGFTKAIDVIGHELTHGVTQFVNSLEYHDQPGALNESNSDVFGSLVKQFALKQSAADADWLIGEGILAPGIKGVALRSMKAPGTAYDDPKLGKDPQPAHMRNYVHTSSDNGGVHINSGIPNHAFYLVAIAVGGNAWDHAGHIWYLGMQRLQPGASFQDAANATVQAAGELYGVGGAEQTAVQDAWAQVGIRVARGAGHGRRAAMIGSEPLGGDFDGKFDKLVDEVKDLRKTVEALGKRIEKK